MVELDRVCHPRSYPIKVVKLSYSIIPGTFFEILLKVYKTEEEEKRRKKYIRKKKKKSRDHLPLTMDITTCRLNRPKDGWSEKRV